MINMLCLVGKKLKRCFASFFFLIVRKKVNDFSLLVKISMAFHKMDHIPKVSFILCSFKLQEFESKLEKGTDSPDGDFCKTSSISVLLNHFNVLG